MKAKKIEELYQIAESFVSGQVNPMTICSMNVFDRIKVLQSMQVYSLVVLGTMSPKSAVTINYKTALEYDDIKRKTEFFAQSHKMWIKRGIVSSCKRTELVKELSNGNGLKVVKLLAELLDEYTSENIYVKLLQARFTDESFCENIGNAVMDNYDYLIQKFGNHENYLKMLEDFYHNCDENGITGMYMSLEKSNLIKTASRCPVKSDDHSKVEANFESFYGKWERNGNSRKKQSGENSNCTENCKRQDV